MVENIEQIHESAVIFIDFLDLDTQRFIPNQIFHKYSPDDVALMVGQRRPSGRR
jgi:hypothetical protein